jgi:hypothetical protein
VGEVGKLELSAMTPLETITEIYGNKKAREVPA